MSDTGRLAIVILAAGQGTRMRSAMHKVLHPIAGRPMLLHLLDTADALGAERKVVVLGQGREQVEVTIAGRGIEIAVQAEQKGTGHAVQQAAPALEGFEGSVLVLYGDTPFVAVETLRRMLERLEAADQPAAVVLASSPDDPQHYGRVILGEGDGIAKMVEYKDATETERAVRLCNSGMMAIRSSDLFRWLGEIGNDNASGEYYLPDVVAIAAADGRLSVAIEGDPFETTGVNSRAELAELEVQWQRRRRAEALRDGASMTDPSSVWFAFDTKLGRDVTIEPNVVFGPGVEIGEGASIYAFSHIEGASIGPGAKIGPFARLRLGTRLAAKAKAGNFVEIKNAEIGEGAKVNHLSYIGDATVGAGANIGAGTITCNYDGFRKYRTVIGEGTFIGSNTALVAPVTIGEGAFVGAGSVITKHVEPDSLAIERSEQKGIAGWAKRFRQRMKSGPGSAKGRS